MSSPTYNKLPLPLLFVSFAILIAMSPLFAEEVFADYICKAQNGTGDVLNTSCFTDSKTCEDFTKCTSNGGACVTAAAGECPASTPTVPKGGGSDSWFWQGLFDVSVGFVLKFLNFLLYGISTVLERLVALSAFLLAMAIDVSSAPFSDLTILKNGWKIVRDVMNSFFVLILFIIAIATILQLESYAWKALLPTFIIVALLVNFSFVLSGVVIDFSNVLGRTFFDKMKPIEDNIAKAFDINNINNLAIASCQPNITTATTGIMGTIVSYAKGWSCAGSGAAQKLFVAHEEIASTPMKDIDALTKYLFVLTLRVVMLFLMIFPLLAGAALMILRTITLMVLIIFAPAAFTAYILPATRSYATQWWTEIFSKSFFFPVYLFMLYIAIQYGIGIGDALKATGKSLGGTFENLATIFNFLTMVAFMFLALTVARKSGIVGAETVLKYADTGRKWATGYAGRMTGVPRLAEKYAQSETAQRLAARGALLGGLVGRPLMKLAERGAKAGGREEVLKSRTDTITKLAPQFQANAYLRAGAPIRKRVEDQLKTEGMAEMMHYTDSQKTRQNINDTVFAYLPPEQRGNAKRKLGDAYADREGNKQSIGQLKGRWNNPKYYSEAEKESIVDEMKTERRARLVAVADDVVGVERMIEKVLGNNARELDKTREEIARYGISLPPNQFLPYFNKLSNETKRRLFDIINPRELEGQMAGFGVPVPGATPAKAAEKTANEAAFLGALQPLGRNRSNIEIRKIAGAVRPKFYSELGYGTQEELVRALTPAEAASMNEEDMRDTAISQHFEGGQLEAIARSQRVAPETRKQIRTNVESYITTQRAGLPPRLPLGTPDPAHEKLDRLEDYLKRTPAYQ